MTDFEYKGRMISVTPSGDFQFIGKDGRPVTKTSLKTAQNAIDKEIGRVVVYAMSADCRRIEIAGRHRSGGYVDPHGNRVGQYQSRIYVWSDDAAAKLEDIRQRTEAVWARHYADMKVIGEERRAILSGLGDFVYEEALATEVSKRDQVRNWIEDALA